MKILTRDDTDHNTEYVSRQDAEAEIEGWKNKWECAVEMAAQSEVKRDDLLNGIRAYRDAKGRYNTQIACEKLLAMLPENNQPNQ